MNEYRFRTFVKKTLVVSLHFLRKVNNLLYTSNLQCRINQLVATLQTIRYSIRN